MSRPMAETPKRRPHRQFTDEFKASAVRLVVDEGKSVGAAARDLDLTETALREWVKRAQADRTKGRTGLTTAEREDLVRHRKALRSYGLNLERVRRRPRMSGYVDYPPTLRQDGQDGVRELLLTPSRKDRGLPQCGHGRKEALGMMDPFPVAA